MFIDVENILRGVVWGAILVLPSLCYLTTNF